MNKPGRSENVSLQKIVTKILELRHEMEIQLVHRAEIKQITVDRQSYTHLCFLMQDCAGREFYGAQFPNGIKTMEIVGIKIECEEK